jgi:hypothetical protein
MQIYVPTVTARFDFGGRRIVLVKGRTTIEEGHPIIEGREHMLEPIGIDFPAPVEKPATTRKAATTE